MKKLFAQMPKKYKISLIFVLGLLSVAGITWKPIGINYGKWLAAGESDPTGDMSVLLSGSNARLKTLIELYEEGKVQGIYYAAGIDETVEDLTEYRNIFAKYKLPTQDLYCGELVESTFNEAQAFKRKLAEIKNPVNKIILVSDRYHLRRGIWSFNKVLGDEIEVTAYSTPSSPEIADLHWWKHQSSREQVIGETKKMGFYFIYYGLLNQGNLITHGDVNRITTGKVAQGVNRPCEIVLPQLTTNK
ncbi:hypothetical protein C7B62_15305 [Pleurocapsa sp. CCALA 161]|uniref:YdcF family protein n=1 Tax=Pleurocapsa sp. CCALA 161 TaxID=2107688 RepID=UPI000D0716B2|nr:ElyC/SanA/YdcF family protein [Pleurocapsa sp. CCALA 161]PSB08868.1 hypothetical protein C7B62_15305 [Pleurocapsa sp. CCALA 161]